MDDEEILEQSDEQVSEQVGEQPEPLVIETKGKWQPFEAMVNQTHEVGHTYEINIQGLCEFAISKDRPTAGMRTNKIVYTKDDTNRLWIKTGG